MVSAYFQVDAIDRLLLKQRRGGIPDPEVPDDAVIVARAPIPVSADADRGFWTRIGDTRRHWLKP